MVDEITGYRLDEVITEDVLVTRYAAFERDERGTEQPTVLHVYGKLKDPLAREAVAAGIEQLAVLRQAAPPQRERLVLPERVEETTSHAAVVRSSFQPSRALPELLDEASLSADVILRLAADIAQALEGLHAAGLSHGLLRPAAISVDDRGVARLGDLGIGAAAHAAVGESSAYLSAVGRFRAPEQTSGEGPSAAADRFALASLIYELLLGRPAFHAPTALATTLKISMAKTPALDAIESLSAPAAKLLAELFSKAPDKRPAPAQLTQRLREMAGREADARRFLSERVSPPADAPAPLDYDAFELPLEDRTSLSTQLPNHIPDGGALPLGDLSLDMPDDAAPLLDRGEPTMLARDPTLPLDDTTSPYVEPQDDGPTRNEIALPERRESTLVLENVGAGQDVVSWGESTLALDSPEGESRFAPPESTRIVPPPQSPHQVPVPELASVFEPPERKPPHPALVYAGIAAGAVVVMGLVALITVLLAG